MMLAASMAGVGFGSAGVHIPHACAYPIAGLKHEFRPPGYPDDHAFVPHGISVIVTAPAAFRFTYEADPERHDRAAELLGGDSLPEMLRALMEDLGVPTGLGALGYTDDDIPALVEGALAQQRLLVGGSARGRRVRPRGDPARVYVKRLTNSSDLSATSRQPLSIVSAWPRFGTSTISVTPGLSFCRL